MEPMPGMVPAGEEKRYVIRLLKAIYGLPQASHNAQRKLRNCLKDGGFEQSKFDACLYIFDDEEAKCYITTHVDDPLSTGTTAGEKRAITTLEKVFEIKITKDPTLILGVQLERNKAERTAKLHQTTYIKAAIDELNLGDCNPSDTPMENGALENIRKRLQEKIGKQGR
jgi:hypothetical protein